ncbi:MAG: hypothetical protein ABSE87_02800 [Terracidiphilus sp.]|jgi:hypothetical protein
MRSLSAAEILRAWERGLTQSPNRRALELLSPLYPQASLDWLSGLSIGRRDAELLALREYTFGPEMAAVAGCPQCGGRLDITLNAAEMRDVSAFWPDDKIALRVAGYELQFRLPNSDDLEALSRDDDGGRMRLLSCCLLSAQQDGAKVESDQLPDEVVDAVSERMASADPLADIQLALCCPLCSHHWQAAFDIASFLWREIENLAGRLLRDVHALASAYGWHEKDILALSPVRRQFYLAMIGT